MNRAGIAIILFFIIFSGYTQTIEKQVILSPDAPKAIGPYSQAILAGNTLYISGQIAIIPETGLMDTLNFETEIRRVLSNLGAVLKEAGMKSKKIITIKRDEPVSEGIVVDVVVKKILLKWNYFSGQPDEYICYVNFTDAVSGQKLFTAIINVNSRAVNPYAKTWGIGFSGRIQIAAYNIALVLTKIMTQGKIDPADY